VESEKLHSNGPSGIDVEPPDGHLDAGNAVVAGHVEQLARPQQRLRRHAPDVDARPAERQAVIDHRRTRAEVVGLDRGPEGARTATEDDEIERVHWSDWRSGPRSRRIASE